ncbi:MAG TPA: peroxiredoxin-like family protein [Actinocrinis sp.]|jgi:peroxiredoxin
MTATRTAAKSKTASTPGSESVPATRRIASGAVLEPLDLTDLAGAPVPVPDPRRLVHLQFRRFAGCPVCNRHLRSFAVRHAELEAAGIREVVLFHSSAADLEPQTRDLPFVIVPDREKRHYRAFGVELAPRALLDPRAWPAIVTGVAHDLLATLRRRKPLPKNPPDGGRLGLPADFLIRSDGRVLHSHYGVHADDQWSLDTVLALARDAEGAATP